MSAFQIPDDLIERDQWSLWRRENGDKIPYSEVTGRRASSTDPRTWGTFEDAIAALDRDRRRWAGLAWFFNPDDPFVGIDLDDCLTGAGELKEWARGIVGRFADTYMEVSPSGRGIKIWAKGSLPRNLGKVTVSGGDGGIEMYSHSRFFAVTGQPFRGAPLQIEDHAADALELYRAIAPAPGRWQHTPETSGRIPHGSRKSPTTTESNFEPPASVLRRIFSRPVTLTHRGCRGGGGRIGWIAAQEA